MGKGPDIPSAQETANAQGNLNFQTAQQNWWMQPNYVTPYGSQTKSQSGWQTIIGANGQPMQVPSYTSTITLSPGEEKLRQLNEQVRTGFGNLAVQQTGQLQKHLANIFNPQDLQKWQAAAAPDAVRRDAAPTDRAAIEQAIMDRYNKDSAAANSAQQTQMLARGMTPGSMGYGTVQKAQSDALERASQGAYLASGEEARAAQDAYNRATQQKYAMGADWAAQLNNLRQNQFIEAQQRRDAPLKEAAALMGFAGPNTPTFTPHQGPNMPNINMMQAVYDEYNAKAAQNQNMWGGIAGIGSAVAGALPWASWLSDRRLKTDVRALPARLAGVPLYVFRYRKHQVVPVDLHGALRVGVMADEVKAVHPDAVHRLRDGFYRVDYELLNMRHANG